MKRVLLAGDDALLLECHRARIEAAGAAASVAADSASAWEQAQETPPDAVLLDALLPEGECTGLIEKFRGSPALAAKPIFLYSAGPDSVLRAAAKLGAKVIASHDDGVGQVIGGAAAALRLPAPAVAPYVEVGEIWPGQKVDISEDLGAIRRALHGFVKAQREPAAILALLREVHRLSERLIAAGQIAASRVPAALEALIYDFRRLPEEVNPSTLQTTTQAVDFLATLFEEQNFGRLVDPATAQVFAVDDEESARDQIVAALKLVHLHTACAGDAQSALSILDDNAFDVILLDVNLPNKSGFDLCTEARQLEDHGKTPVVFITGMATFQNRAKATLSGGNDFIAKPFNLRELGVKTLLWVFRHQLGLV